MSGYFEHEEADPFLFKKEESSGVAKDTDDFDDWIWEGIKEAFRLGKEAKKSSSR